MTRRRSALCVPASEPEKIAKALALNVDEVIVDLEDAVAPERKNEARANLETLKTGAHGIITVRVNASDTQWYSEDLAAAVKNPHIAGIVIPKAEDPEKIAQLDSVLATLEADVPRREPLEVQALIESALGLARVQQIALSSNRLKALIIGYADLAASLGRVGAAPWLVVQEAVILAARIAGIQAVDGPQLTVEDGPALREATELVHNLGFDGKWVIHPRQFQTVQQIFTPADEAIQEARELLAAMDEGLAQGLGAVQWRGRMLDEAIAVQARRILSKAVTS